MRRTNIQYIIKLEMEMGCIKNTIRDNYTEKNSYYKLCICITTIC